VDYNQLGKTGLKVSRLGVGISEIGFNLSLDDEKQASDVLNAALDQGINFFDTAACYGLGEEFVGRTVSNRRDEFFLATKAGHVAGDYEGEGWTVQTITDSIDRSLKRMRTDHLDLIQLHSCGVEVLEKGDAIRAVQDAKDAGKTRFIGYSGDNENALWAVESGLFDTLQTSFNVVDQDARTKLFPKATAQEWELSQSGPSPTPYGELPRIRNLTPIFPSTPFRISSALRRCFRQARYPGLRTIGYFLPWDSIWLTARSTWLLLAR